MTGASDEAAVADVTPSPIAPSSVVWTTAFIDAPSDVLPAVAAFWARVTRSTISATRGDHDQFATLLPGDGDAFLRVQTLGDGPRVHLDLHVADVAAAVADAVAAGATEVLRREHVVLRSPGGFTFCFVPDRGERTRPQPVVGSFGGSTLVDQVCLDIPAAIFDAEGAFWSRITGWESLAASSPEFAVLRRPQGMPLRFLLQRLGPDERGPVRAHLDIACGENRVAVESEHIAAGAAVVRHGRVWTVMVDPAGLEYCLTPRDPVTGTLAH